MPRDESEPPDHPVTDSEVVAEAMRGKTAIETAFPDERKRPTLIPYVSRYRGPEPDFYDAYQAGVWFEMIRSERARVQAVYRKVPADKEATEFHWKDVMKHALLAELEEHTISLGGGKGRKEAVELGKTAQPPTRSSRWSLRRRE